MNKSELRQSYLARQKAISPKDRAAMSEAIARRLFEKFDLRPVSCLHCFIPILKFNEVDTTPIIETVWSDHPNIQVLVPRVDFETREIRNLKFDRATELAKNAWDIEEPIHDALVDVGMIDVVLVPGLCFDRNGHRVGYGKGFYDRFLKTCRADCVKIGLSFFQPVEAIDDVHNGDVEVDFVIFPTGVRTWSGSGPG